MDNEEIELTPEETAKRDEFAERVAAEVGGLAAFYGVELSPEQSARLGSAIIKDCTRIMVGMRFSFCGTRPRVNRIE